MKLQHSCSVILLLLVAFILFGCDEKSQIVQSPSVTKQSVAMKLNPDTVTATAPATALQFTLEEAAYVSIDFRLPGGPTILPIYKNKYFSYPGTYSIVCNIEILASGVYYCSIVIRTESGKRYEQLLKMTYLRYY